MSNKQKAFRAFKYNILDRAASRAAAVPALSLGREGCLMSTYEEFQIILGVAMLIVAILNYTHKK